MASFKNALPSRKESDISLSIVNIAKHAFACFILARYAHNISQKRGSARSIHAMILYVGILNV